MIRDVTNLPFQMGEEYMVVVRGVPALVCNQCGEAFVEITTLRRVEQIVKKAEMDGVTFGFVSYQVAA
jgi:YgiT-type zinc finger domain-containing protein